MKWVFVGFMLALVAKIATDTLLWATAGDEVIWPGILAGAGCYASIAIFLARAVRHTRRERIAREMVR